MPAGLIGKSFATAAALTVLCALIAPGTAFAAKPTGGASGGTTCRKNCTAADTTAPSAAIAAPSSGSILSGTIMVAGSASDNASVSRTEVKVDSGTWRTATGTNSWNHALDTAAYADGSHTISARSTDSSGNVSAPTSVTVTFDNTPEAPPSPTPSASPSPTVSPSPSPTSSPTRTCTGNCMVTPENVVIEVNSAGPWTPQGIYQMLKENARDLDKIGPSLTVKVQDTYSSQAVTSVQQSSTGYSDFTATIYLKGAGSSFSSTPDSVLTHEFGHVWAEYHRYFAKSGDWSSYLQARGLAGETRLDSSYMWDRGEIIADDYRLLFGSAKVVDQNPWHKNYEIADPRNVSGLRDFLANEWTRGA